MELRCQHHLSEGRETEEENLISGGHSCIVLMVLIVKEQRTLLGNETLSSGVLEALGFCWVVGCGRRGRSVCVQECIFLVGVVVIVVLSQGQEAKTVSLARG